MNHSLRTSWFTCISTSLKFAFLVVRKVHTFLSTCFCTQNNSPRWRLTNEQLACYLSLSVTQPLSQTFGGLGRSARVRERSARNFPISLMSDVTIRFRAKLSVADWLNSFSVTRLEWTKEEMHGGMQLIKKNVIRCTEKNISSKPWIFFWIFGSIHFVL